MSDWKEYLQEKREEYIQRKEEEGFEIVYPEENELQIDIDNEASMDTFRKNYYILGGYLMDLDYRVKQSKSGGSHYHIYIKLPYTYSNEVRIAIQAALGSDPTRELLSLIRVLEGVDKPLLLAERKKVKADGPH